MWEKRENRCTPVKLGSKKQAKKVAVEREGGWKVPIGLHDLATSLLDAPKR